MQCLKNIFRRKNAGLSSNSPEFEETDFFRSISFKDYFEEVDLHEEATMTQKPPNKNNVIENETDEMKKTPHEKVNRHEESPGNYWTGNYDEGKNKMQKEEFLFYNFVRSLTDFAYSSIILVGSQYYFGTIPVFSKY